MINLGRVERYIYTKSKQSIFNQSKSRPDQFESRPNKFESFS